MRHDIGRFALSAAFICAAAVILAEKLPFERYQSIIDRMPFGQPPPGFDPTRNPDEVTKDEPQEQVEVLTKEQEEIQRVVQFNAINRDPDGNTMVGFIDKSDPKSTKVYYMAVGETRDGWLVKEADSIEKSMVVEKNGVEVRLSLGENSSGTEKGAAKGKGGKTLAKSSSSSGERSSLLSSKSSSSSGGAQSFKGRRERREAEERATREELERMRAERKKEAEEAAEREAEEKAAREAERAEQREQLLAIQQELKRQREENNARQNAQDEDIQEMEE